MKTSIFTFLAMALLSCGLGSEPGQIFVSGTGEVMVSPDIARLSITLSEKAPTTKEAQNRTNIKLEEVLVALTEAGVQERDIQTSAITFTQDTEYDPERRRNEVIGQIVSQSLNIQFKALDEKPELLPTVLDVLGGIDNIRISNLLFDLEDPQSHYVTARKLAFEKAQQKAQELAEYAGLKLGKARKIVEQGSRDNLNIAFNTLSRAESANNGGSQVPGGQITLQYTVEVDWETYR
jgi:uncharacterized protein YggE